MSQNSNTLLLFFDNNDPLQQCKNALKHLVKDNYEDMEKISSALAVSWKEHWFNCTTEFPESHIRIDFDCKTRHSLPLEELQQLFDFGLTAACIEVFHDQEGEFEYCMFSSAKGVPAKHFFNKHSHLKTTIEQALDCDFDDMEESIEKEIPLSKLIRLEKKQREEAEELVNAIKDMAKVARETGENPIQVARDILVLNAVKKGVFHGVLFGIVTVLLFKGMWLWVSLGAILTFALPVFYVIMLDAEMQEEPEDEQQEEAQC